jgi:tetratricopeptide (TPR) repeat protein
MKILLKARTATLSALLLSIAGASAAQPVPLTLPEASPKASVSQTVGLTDITIAYHRPGVAARKIWGALVPYNEAWRAGANENTTISFSSPVTVGGKTIPAGTYGLHMIPTEGDWTVILSTVSSAWGSFSYDPKEDAVRLTVKPEPAELEERLSYAFDNLTEKSVEAVLRWEKLLVRFPIAVDTPSVVLASIRSQLRGLPRFSWQGWNQAAAYSLRNDIAHEEALAWADRSISMNENFTNLRTKAGLLEKKGDTKAAAALRERSMKIATEADINLHGYQLMSADKMDEAIAMFKKNVKDYPGSWNVYDSLGEAYERKGEKKLAVENYSKALSMVKDDDNKKRISGILTRLKA